MAQAKVRVSRETLLPLAGVGAVKVVEVKAAAEADAAKAVAGAAKVAGGFRRNWAGRAQLSQTEEATALELCISALQARLDALQGA